MDRSRLKSRPWYNQMLVVCVGVTLFVALWHLPAVWNAVRTFIGFFAPVIYGCVIAYVLSPLAGLFARTLFRKARNPKRQAALSNALAFAAMILIVIFALLILIPQLVDSVSAFAANLPGYAASVEAALERFGASDLAQYLQNAVSSSEKLIDTIATFAKDNINNIIATSTYAGKSLFQLFVAVMLSMYLLASKQKLTESARKLMRAASPAERYEHQVAFLRRCNTILNRYIVFNLLDSLIVGMVNAVFMLIFGMPYVGLVSFVVAITNLVPTFGPMVGGAVGAFVLLLVEPWHALAFLVFTVVLQTVDGYILKPKLFGDSLGVSGLWILIGVIVGGRMFGVVGILLAIPGVAILDVVYREYFLPYLERRKQGRPPEKDAAPRKPEP